MLGRVQVPYHLGRRGLLAAPALLLSGRASAADGDYAFKVIRRDEEVGTHTVRFSMRGRQRVAVSELAVVPKVLGIVVYRYEHRYEEVTEGGRFVRVTSRLNRNGRILEARAEAAGGVVRLEGTAGRFELPADAAPLSWWERQRFDRVPLIGTTLGRRLALEWEVAPTRCACRGDVTAETRYDAAGRWVGFRANEDGNVIEYAPA